MGTVVGGARPSVRAGAARSIICFLALLASGCASHLSPSSRAMPEPTDSSVAPKQSLAGYISEVRRAAAAAKPSRPFSAPTLESWDPRLAAALLEARIAPTAANYRQVAAEYRRLRVLDMAHRYLTEAVARDPRDATGFDALARIWRDWGLPHLGLADAHRAVSLAPRSPVAANTLGTLLEATGDTRAARAWYERATLLDPNAAYAANNVCYAAIMLKARDAVGACERAATMAPRSRVAHNNLALAYAARGDFDRARLEFRQTGNPAAADYNTGIVYMAVRAYDKALESFGAALRVNPTFFPAAERAKQARAAAEAQETTGDRD